MSDKKREPMDIGFAVFNGHVNNAFKRVRVALEEFMPSYMERVDEIDKKGNGIMAIFDTKEEIATSVYAALIAFVVNGHAGEAQEEDEDKEPEVRCDNCDWEGLEGEVSFGIEDVSDLLQRVSPGEVMPFGECPECDALVHLIRKTGEA